MSLLLLFAGSPAGVSTKGYASASDASAFGATSVDAFLESVLYPWSMLSPGDIISPDGPPGGTGSSSDAAGGGSSASDA